MKLLARCAFLSVVVSLAGCASRQPAPVVERRAPLVVLETSPAPVETPAAAAAATAAESRPSAYVVKKGDTLYSIALDHGQSYRDLTAWNGLEDPNKIKVGQQLRVLPPAPPEAPTPVAVTQPVTLPAALEVRPLTAAALPAAATQANSDKLKREPRALKRPYSEETLAALRKADAAYAAGAVAAGAAGAAVADAPEAKVETKVDAKVEARGDARTVTATEDAVDWGWPAGGKLINNFVEGSNKGIDIAAKLGDPVLSAAAGKVVYSGSSLRGYGKLVIVKHNAAFLSAYAHNSQLLVKEGQSVAKGQKIAEAGSSDADQTMLHFEIRRQGKPVDPVKQLPSR